MNTSNIAERMIERIPVSTFRDPRKMTEEDYLKIMQMLVASAERNGIVLTSYQRPLEPLAMGNYETVCEVRRKLVRE